MSSNIDKDLSWSSIFAKRWLYFMVGFNIVFHFTAEISASLQAFENNFIYAISLNRILIESIFFIALYILCATKMNITIFRIILAVLFYLTGERVQEAVLQRMHSYTLAIALWGFYCCLGIIAIILCFYYPPKMKQIREKQKLDLALKTKAKDKPKPSMKISDYFQNQFNSFKFSIQRYGKNLQNYEIVLFFLTLILGGSFAIISNPNYGHSITITPQEYDMEFRFWASYDPEWYADRPNGVSILEQFNRHNVIIQNAIFSLRDASGIAESLSPTIYPEDIDSTVATLTWFNEYYPNIRFQFYAYGLGYESCGNYEGSIYTPIMVKRFVDICRNYSLPNVVGIYTDWEGPSRTAPDISNMTLNGWHQALWTDAFAYVRAYFPNWILSCCHPDETYWDRLDDDNDLQYYQRYNIFTPEWDDYGPMVYRTCDTEATEPNSYHSSWYIYAQAYALLEGALNGDQQKASMWIGCTGCGPYANDNIVYEHGKPIDFGDSKGFDALVRDILILKHFGFSSVSLFHAIDQFDDDSEGTGFFDQYGVEDALDRLADLVNGVSSTESFTIWSDGKWTPRNRITQDYLLNFNTLEFLPWFGFFVGFGLFCGYFGCHFEQMSPTTQKSKVS